MDEHALQAVSRLLSKVLRHEPDLVGIQLDAQGWVRIDDLIEAVARSAKRPTAPKRLRLAPALTREVLELVVRTNNKKRFSLSSDGASIRAVQGHSVAVDLGYPESSPPDSLFHGTSVGSWKSIESEGLKAGARHAVHLSEDPATARRVGARHGRPLVLEVLAQRMHIEGHRFSRADNGVWLVASVPPRYLRRWRGRY